MEEDAVVSMGDGERQLGPAAEKQEEFRGMLTAGRLDSWNGREGPAYTPIFS